MWADKYDSLRLSLGSAGLRLAAALFVALSLAPIAWAQAAMRDVLRLVPRDPGFVVAVQDLREQYRKFSESPFMEQFRVSFLGRALEQSKDLQRLAELDRELQKHFQTNLAAIRDEILGDALIFAYWPAENGRTERGLILLKARDPVLLAGLIGKLNAWERQTESLSRLDELTYGNHRYHRRVGKGGKTSYQVVSGGYLALTEDEATVHGVIEALAGNQGSNPLADHFHDMGLDDSFALIWMNPRPFERQLQDRLKLLPEPEASFLRAILRYWRAASGMAVALRLDQDIEISFRVRMEMSELPEPARRFLAGMSRPSTLWNKFPQYVVFALAGRVDWAALAEMAGDFLAERQRKVVASGLAMGSKSLLGLDLQREVLPNLGPEIGFYLAAPPAGQANGFPQAALVLGVRDQPAQRPVDRTVFDTVAGAARLLVIPSLGDRNGTSLKSSKQGTTEVLSLENAQLASWGMQPALAVKASCLVLASSPEAIRRFADGSAPAVAASLPDGRVLIGHLSVGELKRQLAQRDRRQALAQWMATSGLAPPEEAQRRLEDVLSVLDIVEQVNLYQQASESQFNLILQIRPSQPLRRTAGLDGQPLPLVLAATCLWLP